MLLFPIEGLFQDALDFFGVKFKVSQAAGQLSNGVVTYSTKKEGHTVYPSSSGKFFLFRRIPSDDLPFQVEWAVLRKKDFSKSPLLALLLRWVVVSLSLCLLAMMVGLHIFLGASILMCCIYQVPIYDATEGFNFHGDDLANLQSLPLFQKGLYDLPPYAVVTIGYTVTSFITSSSASANTAFLFNILFVVLLAERIKDEDD